MVHDHTEQHGPSTIEDGAAADAGPKRQRGAGRLAAALGLDRRTLYKLQARGAPATFDELLWREWLRMCRPRMAVRAALTITADVPRGPDDPLDAGDDRREATAAATGSPAGAAGGQDAPTNPGGAERESPAIAKLTAETDVRHLQARKLRLEIDEQERRLVARDQVAVVFETLAAAIVAELVDLPAQAVRETAKLLPDMPEAWRKPIRRCVEQAVAELRDRVAKSLRAQLRQALTGKVGADG
jgi:hypothetical protein